jgi:hypothetical protein
MLELSGPAIAPWSKLGIALLLIPGTPRLKWVRVRSQWGHSEHRATEH